MRTQIKIKLQRVKRLVKPNEWGNDYKIVSITGAITLGAYNGEVFRAGDTCDEKQAIKFRDSYSVTVTG